MLDNLFFAFSPVFFFILFILLLKNNFLKKKIFIKKKKLFSNKNIFLVSNSKWLESFAKKSELTKNVKIRTIYNPIETNFWRRREIFSSMASLGLNIKKNIFFLVPKVV